MEVRLGKATFTLLLIPHGHRALHQPLNQYIWIIQGIILFEVRWILEGSVDGTSWIELHRQDACITSVFQIVEFDSVIFHFHAI